MHYYEHGKKTNPPLVLLHGWGLEGERYQKLAKALSQDFRVIVPDMPGFGKTNLPPKAYEVDDYGRRVKGFLTEQGINNAHFIGHSFGGRVLIKMANKYPDLVESVVLTGAPGVERFIPKRTAKRVLYWSAAKGMKGLSFLPPIKRLKNRFYADRDFGKVEGIMKDTFLKVIRERLDTEAKNIQQPTLLLWGLKDQMAPAKDAEKMLKLIPNSYLKMFTKSGHKLPYEKPEEFAREVRQFLS